MSISLQVLMIDGTLCPVSVGSETTVKMIIEQVGEESGVAEDYCELRYSDTLLDKTQIILELGVVDGEQLTLEPSARLLGLETIRKLELSPTIDHLCLHVQNGGDHVQSFIDAGVPTATNTGPACWTPLHAACSGGNVAASKILVANGADIDAQDANGDTPLSMSIDHIDVVKFLISEGANIDRRNVWGFSPLRGSINDISIECLNVLIESGVNVNTAGYYDSMTPVMVLCDSQID